jgi:hypothetical protein
MDKSVPLTIPVALSPFLFVGMWCAISYLLSAMGGWRRLAESFLARDEPCGRHFFMRSGKVGLVNYGNCLTIYTAPRGFYLSVWPPFRLGHPPLFIPWDAVRNPTTRRFLWFERVAFDVGSPSVATLELSKKIFEGQSVGV